MLEMECKDALLRMCDKVVMEHGKACLAVPKRKGRPENEFREYIEEPDGWHAWDGWLVKKIMDTRVGNVARDCFSYFVHSEKMLTAWVRKRYGDLETAMRETKKFRVLFEEFTTDFEKERCAFMEKTTEMIMERAGELKRQAKLPQSHGGVANLLKILTQTMKQQGSSIKTIAKVKYTICMQAGIFVPDEFITDVLVAANIERDAP